MKYVPNALTIARIVLTPVMLVCLVSNTLVGLLVATGIFVVAAVSDYLDGKIARSYKVRSRLGQFLDPFADKVLVLGTFVALAFMIPEVVPWWAVVLIALRDVAVTGLRTLAESRGRSLRTLQIARAKTAVQIGFLIAVLMILTASKLPGGPGSQSLRLLNSPIPFIIMIVVVAFTLVTGALYLIRQEYSSSASDTA